MFLHVVHHSYDAGEDCPPREIVVAKAYDSEDDMKQGKKALPVPYAAWLPTEDKRNDPITIRYFAAYGLDITTAQIVKDS